MYTLSAKSFWISSPESENAVQFWNRRAGGQTGLNNPFKPSNWGGGN
jgi:hypothetical protein